MTRTALALTGLILLMQLAQLAKTERVRNPVGACESALARFTPQPWEGKGAVFDDVSEAERVDVTTDWTGVR